MKIVLASSLLQQKAGSLPFEAVKKVYMDGEPTTRSFMAPHYEHLM